MVKRPAACSLLLSTRHGFCERRGGFKSEVLKGHVEQLAEAKEQLAKSSACKTLHSGEAVEPVHQEWPANLHAGRWPYVRIHALAARRLRLRHAGGRGGACRLRPPDRSAPGVGICAADRRCAVARRLSRTAPMPSECGGGRRKGGNKKDVQVVHVLPAWGRRIAASALPRSDTLRQSAGAPSGRQRVAGFARERGRACAAARREGLKPLTGVLARALEAYRREKVRNLWDRCQRPAGSLCLSSSRRPARPDSCASKILGYPEQVAELSGHLRKGSLTWGSRAI